MKKVCIPLLLTILFTEAAVYAQSDTDTDPNRWENVQSWTGTFTFASKEEIMRVEGDATVKSSTDVNLDGSFTLDTHVTTSIMGYGWQGKGIASGPYWWELVTTQSNGSSCTALYFTTDPIAPLVGTPGYQLEWFPTGANKGKYIFTTGEIKIPVTLSTSCDGNAYEPVSQDIEIGGASTAGYRTLPASGYHLTGDAEYVFNGFNSAWFHWDLQPKEFKPATTGCPFEAALHDTAGLNILREVRNVMAATPAGIPLVYLFYSNAAEVTKILAADAELQKQFRELIIDNMNYAQELVAGRQAAIPCETAQDITGFLINLKPSASPKLDKAIAWVLQGIEDASLLDSLGIRVMETKSN